VLRERWPFQGFPFFWGQSSISQMKSKRPGDEPGLLCVIPLASFAAAGAAVVIVAVVAAAGFAAPEWVSAPAAAGSAVVQEG